MSSKKHFDLTPSFTPDLKPVSVIDIGSHSVRLVVYDRLVRAPTSFFNEKVLCGLGKGLALSGVLNAEGIERSLKAFARFRVLCDYMGVVEHFCIATAAVREALNGQAFISEAESVLKIPIRILTGEEEGYFAAMGVISGISCADGVIGDLGGGSLELVHVLKGKIGESVSLPLGPLRVRDLCGASLKLAKSMIDDVLQRESILGFLKKKNFYAVGGAWRSLARFHMKQNNYPLHVLQNYTLDRKSATIVAQSLSEMSPAILRQNAEISRARSETLPFGALVLARLLSCAKPKSVVISAGGVREGLLFHALAPKERLRDPLLIRCQEFAQRYSRSLKYVEELVAWTASCAQQAVLRETVQEARLRTCACLLSDMGWRVHPDYRGEHSLLFITQASFLEIDHFSRVFMALVLFFRYDGVLSEKVPVDFLTFLSEETLKKTRILAAFIRLAYVLSGAMPGVLPHVVLRKGQKGELVLFLKDSCPNVMGEAVEKAFERLAFLLEKKAMIIAGG